MALFGRRKDEGETPPRPETERPPAPPPERARIADGPAADESPRQDAGGDAERSEGSEPAQRQTSGATPPSRGDTVASIGKSIIFKGELSGDEDLEIDGHVEGDIKLPNHVLTIGAHGKVKASVVAKCVQVVGNIAGNVTATERVEIEASGIVEGDIRAPRLLVQEGAVVNGAIEMTGGQGGATTKPAGEAPKSTASEGAAAQASQGEASRKAG